MSQFSAIDIKRLWHANVPTEALTAESLKAMLSAQGTKEIKNVHQDTWTIEEAESSQDSYRNQLTGMVYRRGSKTMGEVTFAFTIGRYDFETKKELMGGTATANSWARSKQPTDIKRCLIALTEDGVYCVLTYADISAREANTDGAVGIAVVGTALEPENEAISSEYWFDAEAVG